MYKRISIFSVANRCQDFIPVMFTRVLAHDDEGNCCVKILEKELEPLSSLSWDDYSLERLVKSGVDIKSLGISKDLRMGFDSEIDEFNERLMSLSDKLYDVEQPKN